MQDCMTCNCTGPQNGDPLCPCRMRAVEGVTHTKPLYYAPKENGNRYVNATIKTEVRKMDNGSEINYPAECIKVLDKGFVRLVDVMGDDASIVSAARVSYGKGTKTVNEDTGLIRYLLRHKHTTPFEMVDFIFQIRCPIFVARQWFRHRTASYNEVSGRYSEMEDMYYVPGQEKITKQSTTNKQGGSDEVLECTQSEQGLFTIEQKQAHKEYEGRLERDMRKELARINLPLALYTTFYFKMNLHNLMHFLRLRLDSHAQYEIRVYGQAMAKYVADQCPIAWQAFEDYALNAMQLSALEIEALKSRIIGQDYVFTNKREAEEFQKKLDRLFPAKDTQPWTPEEILRREG